jgi:Arc/MetJ-type ribon-helix-helix transcriptional regulator
MTNILVKGLYKLPKRISKEYAEDDYTTIRIPNDLVKEMDTLIGVRGFKSRAEIVKEAVREILAKYQKEIPALPRFEQINSDEHGTKILDRQLHEVVQIYIKPSGIKCGFHQTDDCEHIDYALKQKNIQNLIRLKKKENWKLPDI